MIVLFGATGYTGRLTAKALVEHGARPVLVARDPARVRAVAAEVGGLDVAVADASDPAPLEALLVPGAVLVSTVGPFVRVGDAAVTAAIRAGATYLDSTGEPPFVRRVFEEFGPKAAASGARLLTAFGYDYVPGNLAGALALREAADRGDEAVRVAVGYFVTGAGAGGASGGTLASLAAVLLAPSHAWRGGRLVTERLAARVGSFDVQDRRRGGVSVGGSEHLALPRLAPSLRDVEVVVAWAGPLSRAAQAASFLLATASRAPGVRSAADAMLGRLLPGSSGGPHAAARSRAGSLIVAEAYDASDRRLAQVVLIGGNPYDFTARILAWGAITAEAGPVGGEPGALGPVEAFGLDALEAGCADAGLHGAGTESSGGSAQ